MKFDKFQRKTFPRLVNTDVKQFPIPIASQVLQKQIADVVSLIMSKAESKQDYSKENDEIDELVMDAYGLTDEEKQEVRDFTF